MSLVLKCLHCKQPAKVPQFAFNCGLRCRKCAGLFMVVPKQLRARLTMLAPARSKSLPTSSRWVTHPAACAEPEAVPEPVAAPLFKESSDPFLVEAPKTSTVPAAYEDDDVRAPAHFKLGLAALIVGIGGLLCASFAGASVLVMPLAALGALLGLSALLLAWRGGGGGRLAGAGTAVSCVILFAAILAPGLLGTTYQVYRQQVPRDTAAMQVVLLPGQKPAADLRNPDGIDASRAGLRQGNLHVQVVSVERVKGDSSVFRKPPADVTKPWLVLRLRIQRTGGGREFAADQWEESSGTEQPQLTLTDGAGNIYRQEALELRAGASGQAQASTAFPVVLANPGFVFAAPAPEVDKLYLQVPADAWGGVGVFRFSIPPSLIRAAPTPAEKNSPPGTLDFHKKLANDPGPK